MALFAAVILAALFLEDRNLGSALLFQNLGDNARALNHRFADCSLFTVADEQNVFQSHAVTGISLQLFDLELVVFLNLILLSARANNCKHF